MTTTLEDAAKFYTCFMAFYHRDDDDCLYGAVFDKRFQDIRDDGNLMPIFWIKLSQQAAQQLSACVRGEFSPTEAVVIGGMTEEDLLAWRESGEESLGTSLPPERNPLE